MMDEFIDMPKPYLLLATSCDEILVINYWNLDEENLVSDSICNTTIQKYSQEFTRNDK